MPQIFVSSFLVTTPFQRYLNLLNEKPVNVLLAESVRVGTLSESVCDNVWESKADTLCRPACAQTLVLVNPFSKHDPTIKGKTMR